MKLKQPDQYICQRCKKTYPLSDKFFQPVKNFKWGFSTYCNDCDKETRIINRNK